MILKNPEIYASDGNLYQKNDIVLFRILWVCSLTEKVIISQRFEQNFLAKWKKAVKGLQPSALIFHEWNKNCFLFILIISNRI